MQINRRSIDENFMINFMGDNSLSLRNSIQIQMILFIFCVEIIDLWRMFWMWICYLCFVECHTSCLYLELCSGRELTQTPTTSSTFDIFHTLMIIVFSVAEARNVPQTNIDRLADSRYADLSDQHQLRACRTNWNGNQLGASGSFLNWCELAVAAM